MILLEFRDEIPVVQMHRKVSFTKLATFFRKQVGSWCFYVFYVLCFDLLGPSVTPTGRLLVENTGNL